MPTEELFCAHCRHPLAQHTVSGCLHYQQLTTGVFLRCGCERVVLDAPTEPPPADRLAGLLDKE